MYESYHNAMTSCKAMVKKTWNLSWIECDVNSIM